MLITICAGLAAVAGVLGTYAWCLRREGALREELSREREQLAAARGQLEGVRAQLEGERRASAEKLELLREEQRKIEQSFAALSRQALDANSAQLLQLAEQALDKRAGAVADLVKPVRESLAKVDDKLGALEKQGASSVARISEQMKHVAEGGEKLRGETAKLVAALKAPAQRGRWGELQLRNTIELAGLRPHVDYLEQQVVAGADGTLRPDVVVKLPGGKSVLIDAKVPLEAFLRAVESPDAERALHLRAHAEQLRAHVLQLAKKQYWEAFAQSPELILLFVPGEELLAAALEANPTLHEEAFQKRVVLCTPGTLLSSLLTIAHVWKQEAVEENAREIAAMGRELHKRIAKLTEHLARLGRALGTVTGAYDDLVGSFETRVLPGARKFEALKAASSDVEVVALPPVAAPARLPAAAESVADDAN